MPASTLGQALAGGPVLASILYAFLGVALMLVAYRIFDAIHPLDFNAELEKGNVAAGVTVAGVLIGVAIIVAAAII
jgi:uncharacterized membrane protein YjfL (UPF0719 family)